MASENRPPAERGHRTVVVPGDGIGREVVPAGREVLEARAQNYPDVT